MIRLLAGDGPLNPVLTTPVEWQFQDFQLSVVSRSNILFSLDATLTVGIVCRLGVLSNCVRSLPFYLFKLILV